MTDEFERSVAGNPVLGRLDKRAPERNGNLVKMDSFAFSNLDFKTKMAILKFNTDKDRATLDLSNKLIQLKYEEMNKTQTELTEYTDFK